MPPSTVIVRVAIAMGVSYNGGTIGAAGLDLMRTAAEGASGDDARTSSSHTNGGYTQGIWTQMLTSHDEPAETELPQFLGLGLTKKGAPEGWVLVSIPQVHIKKKYDLLWCATAKWHARVEDAGGNKFVGPTATSDGEGIVKLDLHFLVPKETKAFVVELIGRNHIGFVVGGESLGTFTLDVGREQLSFEHKVETHWVFSGTVQSTITRGTPEDVNTKLEDLSEAGIELTDPWNPVLHPDSVASHWQKWRYVAATWSYALNGMMGDTAGEPVSGIYEAVDAKRDAGGKFGNTGLVNGPGPHTTSIVAYDLVVEAMASLPLLVESHDRFRRNELGKNFFNGAMWPEKRRRGIALGDSVADHGHVRKLLDKTVGPSVAGHEDTVRMVREAANRVWEGKEYDSNSASKYNIKLLFKLHLGMDIDDDEAAEFIDNQLGFLAVAGAPAGLECAGLVYSCSSLLKYKEALLKKIIGSETFPEKVGAAEWHRYSDLRKTKLASGMLDSMIFAGGLSVPTVISNVLAILYGEYGQHKLGANFTLTPDNVPRLVMETIRRIPPVGGFPSWDRKTNEHVIIDIASAQLDTRPSENGWGETARDFVLRGMDEYNAKMIAWADKAIVEGDSGNPASRVCPGKDMSILFLREFFTAFVEKGGGQACWASDVEPSKVTISGFKATSIKLTKKTGCGNK